MACITKAGGQTQHNVKGLRADAYNDWASYSDFNLIFTLPSISVSSLHEYFIIACLQAAASSIQSHILCFADFGICWKDFVSFHVLWSIHFLEGAGGVVLRRRPLFGIYFRF